MTTTKPTSIILTPTTRRQLAELGGQQSETIRRAIAVLWLIEKLRFPIAPGTSINKLVDAANHASEMV